MNRLSCYITVLMLAAFGCAQTPQIVTPEPQPQPQVKQPEAAAPRQPSEKLKVKTDSLVKELGDKDYRKRKDAHEVLDELLHGGRGGAVLECLRRARKEAGDPEVKERLERILEPYEQWRITGALLDSVPDIVEHLEKFPNLKKENDSSGKSTRNALIILGEPAVAPLLKALQSDNKKLRRYAAEILGETGSARAIDGLVAALKDTDREVKEKAALALGKIGAPRAVEPLLEALTTLDRFVSGCAAAALRQMADESALEGLLEALKHEYSWVRDGAAAALGALKSERAVDSLVKLLKGVYPSARGSLGDGPRLRSSAIQALGQIGGDKAVAALIEIYKTRSCYSDVEAAEMLGKLGDARAIGSLVDALDSDDRSTRTSAAMALGEIGGNKAVKALIPLLKHEDHMTRRCTAIALGITGNKGAVGQLLNLLKDEDTVVRAVAANALGEIGSEKATDLLKQMLNEEKKGPARVGAASGLFKLTGDETALNVLVEFSRGPLGWYAVHFMQNLRDERTVKTLIELLGNQQKSTYWYAWRALVKLAGNGVVEPLIEALEHSNWNIRIGVRSVLRKASRQDFRFDAEKWKEWHEKSGKNE